MANTVKHTFQSTIADGPSDGRVQPSHWNAEHTFAGGTNGAVLVRDSAQTDGAIWSSDYTGNLELKLLTAGMVYNGSLAASVSGTTLTVALKAKDGTDPTSTNQVQVVFRSSTAGDGKIVVRNVTSALSFTVSAGSTLGTQNGIIHRLYVYLIDNASTVEMAIYNPYNAAAGTLRRQPDWGLVSTTAEGGGGLADNPHTLYSAVARTNVPIVLLGYLESTQTTAGTWATAPSLVQTVYPGMPRTGDAVLGTVNVTDVVASTINAIPFDNTVPQNTEGVEAMTVTHTPLAGPNLLVISHSALYDALVPSAYNLQVCLFVDAEVGARKSVTYANDNDHHVTAVLHHQMLAESTAARTFRIRFGIHEGATSYFNEDQAGRTLGGTVEAFLRVDEIWA